MENQIQPQAPQSVSQNSKKGILKIIASFAIALLVLGAAGGAYYYFNKMSQSRMETEETPPALKVNTLQGKSVETGYLVFTAEDEANNKSDAEYFSSDRGIVGFWSEEDTTISKIIEQIKAQNGQKVLVAFYSSGTPEEKQFKRTKGYHTYPKGPFQGTQLFDSEAVIPKYSAFLIISNKNIDVLKDSGLHRSDEFAESYQFQIESDTSGWKMLVLPENVNDAESFKDFINFESGRIDKVFAQKSQDKFEELPIADIDNFSAEQWAMVWVRIQPEIVIRQMAPDTYKVIPKTVIELEVTDQRSMLINPVVIDEKAYSTVTKGETVEKIEDQSAVQMDKIEATSAEILFSETIDVTRIESASELESLSSDAATTADLDADISELSTTDLNMDAASLNLNITETQVDAGSMDLSTSSTQLNTGSTSLQSISGSSSLQSIQGGSSMLNQGSFSQF